MFVKSSYYLLLRNVIENKPFLQSEESGVEDRWDELRVKSHHRKKNPSHKYTISIISIFCCCYYIKFQFRDGAFQLMNKWLPFFSSFFLLFAFFVLLLYCCSFLYYLWAFYSFISISYFYFASSSLLRALSSLSLSYIRPL